MPRSTTPAAGHSALLVPNLGAIKILVAGLEEGRKFCHSRFQDGVKAPQWVEIRNEVPNLRGIEAQLQAMGYEYSHGRKRYRLWRDTRQLLGVSPDLHEDDKPVQETRAMARASSSGAHPGASSSAHPGASSSGACLGAATLHRGR